MSSRVKKGIKGVGKKKNIDLDDQFNAFLKEVCILITDYVKLHVDIFTPYNLITVTFLFVQSISSEDSSLDTARVNRYLKGVKEKEKPWWANEEEEDEDDIGSYIVFCVFYNI